VSASALVLIQFAVNAVVTSAASTIAAATTSLGARTAVPLPAGGPYPPCRG
jgi:hypothetical protein